MGAENAPPAAQKVSDVISSFRPTKVSLRDPCSFLPIHLTLAA